MVSGPCAPSNNSSAQEIIPSHDAFGIGCSLPRTAEPWHMGMHGEAWVTMPSRCRTAYRVGMRFDDRVTGDFALTPRAPARFISRLTAPKSTATFKVDAALVGEGPRGLERLAPHIETRDHGVWIRHITELKGDSAVRDIQSRPIAAPLCRARHQ